MPRVVWNTQADFDNWYNVRVRNPAHPQFGQRVGYGRIYAEVFRDPGALGVLSEYEHRANLIEQSAPAPGLVATDRILIVGCGFGYLIEALKDRGYPLTFGIDSSSDIESRKGVEARGDVVLVSEDMNGTGRTKNQLRQNTGDDEFDWIVTETMLESYDDAEIQTILNVIEGGLYAQHSFDHALHLVMDVRDPARPDDSIDPAFNQKTLAEWNAMRPAHTWISISSGEVL